MKLPISLAVQVERIKNEKRANDLKAQELEIVRKQAENTEYHKGDVGPRGLTGPQGARGERGEQGLAGPMGARGPQGDRGLQGDRGAQGEPGPIGPQGKRGVQGARGDTGPQGPVGPQGATGQGFRWRGPWDRSTTYQAGDVVEADGSSWVALYATTGDAPNESSRAWGLLARRGDQGVAYAFNGGGTAVSVSPTNGNGLSVTSGVLSLALAVAGGANGALAGSDKTKLNNLSGTNSGDLTLSAPAGASNANGATLSGQALTLTPADGTNPGLLTAGTQTVGGAKTFSALATFNGGTAGSSASVRLTANTALDGGNCSGFATMLKMTTTDFWRSDATWQLGTVNVGNNKITGASSLTSVYTNNLSNAPGRIVHQFQGAGGTQTDITSKLLSICNNTTEKIAWDINGKAVYPATGTADVVGQATLSAGTVTVSTTAVKTGDFIELTHGGTGTVANFGQLYPGTITDATSFVINSSNASDNDKVTWRIFKRS